MEYSDKLSDMMKVDEPYEPFRGVLIGLIGGVVMWMVILAAFWMFLR